ncbi:MAG: 1,4-beta-glucanase [Oscillospiraceae bacterium]|nr:1,4-beta-glucanase [Oscillospiraceae bacterium]
MFMRILKKLTAAALSAALLCTAVPATGILAADGTSIESSYTWGTLHIGGAGFVSGIVTGQKEMYLRTDVGGAYKYDYTKKAWVQLFGFLNEEQRGLLSVKGIAIDPTDDNTAYFLCGCAYFSGARTSIFKTTDGGKTFTESDVTDLIQIHGNGDGRECAEPIAIDPDDPDTVYAGGDVTAGESALIKSTDGGKTWKAVPGYDALGLFTQSLKYPSWTDHMVRGTEKKEYNEQNGIACILIEGGKVYVGTSVTGQANIHVADVATDEFKALSKDLPTANYPVSISSDKNGNLFFTYIAGLAFSGSAGGAYAYNVKAGSVKKLSVTDNAVGMITVDRNDPTKMVARTCGLWSDQWFEEEWTEGSIAWGDHFFRSTDGGETWQDITPGQQVGQYTDNHYFVSNPIDTGGYDWIYGKACHWGSGILIDPRNSDKILLTSGNGVYACDNVWDEKGVQFYFDPNGVEEVVALDMVSVPGGAAYSAIGDYDGFIHTNVSDIPQQYQPNIGSTSAIAYCPADPKVMARASEHDAKGYYSLDGGKTWKELGLPSGGGKMAITQLSDGTYRFIKANADNATVQYSDDFGGTWQTSEGTSGTRTTYPMVDPENPAIVYGSGIKYNSYWASDMTKKEPTLDDAQYDFYVSTDYGATFTRTIVCMYDQCDHTGDLAYISTDKLAMAVGWNGMYFITDGGATIEKSDVYYCKSIGYGAPEKEGGPNTLYIYGRPDESDPEGIYRSVDGGESWVCINTQHLYGGTGNGNFIVGDMNTFGKVYMSTVGCGIVYGMPSDATEPELPTDSELTVTIWGDADDDGDCDIMDVICVNKEQLGSEVLSEQGALNADVDRSGGLSFTDAVNIMRSLVDLVKLPV